MVGISVSAAPTDAVISFDFDLTRSSQVLVLYNLLLRINNLRGRLVVKNFAKEQYILRHIESLNTCMKH
jgi:hypothetical protein